MPGDLGVRDGRLKPPSTTPNSVSSQAALYPDNPQRAYAAIAPFPAADGGPQTLERIRRIVEGMPGAKVVKSDPGYLHVQFTTRWMKFVDDAEFWFDPRAGVIHVRSASRLGRKDFGVNRARVEAHPRAPRRRAEPRDWRRECSVSRRGAPPVAAAATPPRPAPECRP